MAELPWNREVECAIWNTGASLVEQEADSMLIDSARAGGLYWISGRADIALKREDERLKALLTSMLIEKRLAGEEYPNLDENTIEESKDRRPLSVPERADRLLEYISQQNPYLGYRFNPSRFYTVYLYPLLAWSESMRPASSEREQQVEIQFLLNYLETNGWMARGDDTAYYVTVEGFSHLAELKHKIVPSAQAFVAMWFDETVEEAYRRGIEPAILSCGYEATRVDQIEHTGKIDDRIIAELRNSRFVVADFTQGEDGARGGVYYEAGFAHGLNIPVIFTCREDCIKLLHFDTRQYVHITWTTPEELRGRLQRRISATVT